MRIGRAAPHLVGENFKSCGGDLAWPEFIGPLVLSRIR